MSDEARREQEQVGALEADLSPSKETAGDVVGGRALTDSPLTKRKKQAKRARKGVKGATQNLTDATRKKLSPK